MDSVSQSIHLSRESLWNDRNDAMRAKTREDSGLGETGGRMLRKSEDRLRDDGGKIRRGKSSHLSYRNSAQLRGAMKPRAGIHNFLNAKVMK